MSGNPFSTGNRDGANRRPASPAMGPGYTTLTQQIASRIPSSPPLGVQISASGRSPTLSFAQHGCDAPASPGPWEGSRRSSTVTVDDENEKKRVEAELEAERLWWSEASERQVKELETQFGEEFQRTTQKLRADISAVQDRLEILVESEKSSRQAGLADLRRDLEAQQVMIAEMTEQQSMLKGLWQETRNSSASGHTISDDIVSKVHDTHRVTASQSVQMTTLESAYNELRKDIAGLQGERMDQQATSMMLELRTEFEAFKENNYLQNESNQEVAALHQIIIQSAGDLGRGIEEVSAAVLSTENKLQQDLADARGDLEQADSRQRQDLMDILQTSVDELSRNMHVLRGELKADLEMTKSVGGDTAPASDIAYLIAKYDQLDAVLAEQVKAAAETALRAEQISITAAEHTNELETRVDTELVEERQLRKSETDKVWSHINELGANVQQPQPSSEAEPRSHRMLETAHRVDVLEGRTKLLAQRVEEAIAPVEALNSQVPALQSRMGVVELEVQGLVQDVGPLSASLSNLRAELDGVKARVESTPSTTAAPLTPHTDVSTPTYAGFHQPAPVLRSHSPGPFRHAAKPSQGSSELPLPSLSADLKETLNNLVHKVNHTLTAKPDTREASVERSAFAGTQPAGSVDNTDLMAAIAGPNARGLDTMDAQEGFIRALQAVQDLRERNLSLREENAELAEKLLTQDPADGTWTPASVDGSLPQWPPSAQQSASACATPSRHTAASIQLPIRSTSKPLPSPQMMLPTAQVRTSADAMPGRAAPALLAGGQYLGALEEASQTLQRHSPMNNSLPLQASTYLGPPQQPSRASAPPGGVAQSPAMAQPLGASRLRPMMPSAGRTGQQPPLVTTYGGMRTRGS